MGNVPTANLNAYYATTTPGNTIQSGPIDPALQDLAQTINDNWAEFSNFILALLPTPGELGIPDQTIVSRHIRNSAIITSKLAALGVTTEKLADGSITLAKLADLVVTAAKIANGTITEPKYADGSVGSRALAPHSVIADKIDPALLAPISNSTVQSNFDKHDYLLTDTRFGVKGDGVTDDTASILYAINYMITNGVVIFIPSGDYVISDTLLFSYGSTIEYAIGKGFKFIGQDVNNTRFLVKMTGKPAMKFANINNNSLSHGVEVGGFSVVPYSTDYQFLGDGIVLENCIGNLQRNIRIGKFVQPMLLTTNPDTAIAPTNTGYTEQNVFEDIIIDSGTRGVTFKVGETDTWNSSFHGNIFNRVIISTTGTSLQEAVAINIESGNIYNCTFNIKVFIAGPKSYLLHFNGDSGTNVGTISYEVFGSDLPKIRTGDNALAKFFFDGHVHGLGNIDWSEYHTASIGELDYNNNKTPIVAGNLIIGRDKFFSMNMLPAKQITSINLFGKQTKLFTGHNVLADLYQGIMHYFARYQNTTGSQENGFIMACKEASGAGARLIIGTIPPDKNDIQDMVPGFYLRATGSYIRSVPNNIQLNFTAAGIGTDGSTINLAASKTPTSATAAGTAGDICHDSNYIYVCVATNTWKRVAISTW